MGNVGRLHQIVAAFLNCLHVFQLQIPVDLFVDVLNCACLDFILGQPTVVQLKIAKHTMELMGELVRLLPQLMQPVLIIACLH